jgi:hypothetical protein
MPCQSCEELCVRYRIDSPSDLRKAIKIAFENIQDGTLREVASPGQGDAPTIQELAHGAAPDDIVSFSFECQTCGKPFRLHAETYHGSGGYWEPA